MGLKDELVRANDPVEEEEEEVDLVDPQDAVREACRESSHSQHLKEALDQCTERVNSRQNTQEVCTMELFDFLHSVEHCASQTLFSKLK